MNPVPFIGQQPRVYVPPPGVYFPRRRPLVLWPTIFAAPANLRVYATGETTTTLRWDDNSTTETGFEVDRALGDGSFSQIATPVANATSLDDTGLVEGTRYRYRVRGIQGLPTTTLTTSLVAFWLLGEASGSRADQVGSNTLVDNNTVTQAVGIVGNAAQFTNANSEHLSIVDNADLSAGDVDFSISTWVFLDNNTTSQSIVNKWVGGNQEYSLIYNQSVDRFRLAISSDGTLVATVDANNLGSPSTSTWYNIVVWHDATANTINIVVNDGAVDSAAHTTGVFDGTTSFNMGALNGSTFHLDGRVDATGMWKKVLSSAERTSLYNSGAGLEHPFVSVPTSSYSNIATVVTHTRSSDTGFSRELTLPRFDVEDLKEASPQPIIDLLNSMAQKVEDKFNTQVARDEPCDVCITNGAIVLDASRCNKFNVAVDEDITSISIIRQGVGQDIEVAFTPDGPGHTVAGWPIQQSGGITGSGEDQFGCGNPDNPLVLVPNFATIATVKFLNENFHVCARLEPSTSEPKSGGGDGWGETALAIECEATVDAGDYADSALEATSCAAMNCAAGSPALNYRGVGGVKPYSWSISAPSASGVSPVTTVNVPNSSARITPGGTATDDGNRAYGSSYIQWTNGPGECTVCQPTGGQQYRCDGTAHNACNAGSDCANPCNENTPICKLSPAPRCNGGTPFCETPANCNDSGNALRFTCDLRSAGQISSGTCEPCSINVDTAVLTLTDAVGNAVSVVVGTAGQ